VNPNYQPIDAIIAPSHYAAAHESVRAAVDYARASKMSRNRPPLEVHVINPGVDLQRFSGSVRTSKGVSGTATTPKGVQLGLGEGERYRQEVGFVARVADEKSPGLFVRAAAIVIQQWRQHQGARGELEPRFVLVGAGPLLDHLRRLAVELGLNSEGGAHAGKASQEIGGWCSGQLESDALCLPGAIYGADLPKRMEGMSMIVNPSLRAWSETFCIANIEAMSLGIPLVSFGVGGVGEYFRAEKSFPEHLKHQQHGNACEGAKSEHCAPVEWEEGKERGNGLLVRMATPAALAEAISWLLLHQEEGAAMGQRGRERVRTHFTQKLAADKYERLYRQLLHDKTKAYG
jgi:glycosyltransferase involved in cell wall biosynthesis